MKLHRRVAVVCLALLLFAAEIHGGENDKETKEEKMRRREEKRRERQLKRAERKKHRKNRITLPPAIDDMLDIQQSTLHKETIVKYENGVEIFHEKIYETLDKGMEGIMDYTFGSAEPAFDVVASTLPRNPSKLPLNPPTQFVQPEKALITQPPVQVASQMHKSTHAAVTSPKPKTPKIMLSTSEEASQECTDENTNLKNLVNDTQKLYDYVQMYQMQMIDEGQLQRNIMKQLTDAGVGMACKNEFHYDKLYPFQLDIGFDVPYETREDKIAKYTTLEAEGFLSKGTVGHLNNDDLTIEDVEKELRDNEEYVMLQFPEKVGEMWEDDRIPEYLVNAFNDQSVSIEELRIMVYNDDDMVKAMMPMKIRDLLESRPPPPHLKFLLYSNGNDTIFIMKVMTNETLLVEIMSPSMHYFYELFKDPKNMRMNMAMSGLVILALVCVMTSLGSTMTIEGIMEHAKHPKGVIIALIAQFGIMPATAFALTQAFQLDVYPAIAILICGCCPGGNLSNMLAFAINGDMDLSILMTTCSSVIGLGMMPFSIYFYSRFIVPLDGGNIIPFGKIILNIVLTILPVSLGLAIKRYRPHWTSGIMKFGAVMLVLCSTSFMIIAGFLMGEAIFVYFPSTALACCAILPMTGYTLGYLAAWIFREPSRCRRTISVETGCQNVQLCGTVLKLAFNPVLVGVMVLLPIVYMVFQASEAMLLVLIYRVLKKYCGKPDLDDISKKSINFDDDDDDEKKDSNEVSKTIIEITEDKLILKTADKSEDSRSSDDAKETWPLNPDSLPPPDYLDSFKSGKKENGGKK